MSEGNFEIPTLRLSSAYSASELLGRIGAPSGIRRKVRITNPCYNRIGMKKYIYIVTLVCPKCEKSFEIRKGSVSRALRQRPGKPILCRKCSNPHPKKTPILVQCAQCGTLTSNPKFCRKSCAATYNNLRMPKRKKEPKFCKGCGAPTKKTRKTCSLCRKKKDYASLTLEEVKLEMGSRNAYHTCVRWHSRTIAESQGKLAECAECGYTTFVDCCHIIPVADFPLTATLAEVNAPDNLTGLCPNHHKEFDAGLLKLVGTLGLEPRVISSL